MDYNCEICKKTKSPNYICRPCLETTTQRKYMNACGRLINKTIIKNEQLFHDEDSIWFVTEHSITILSDSLEKLEKIGLKLYEVIHYQEATTIRVEFDVLRKNIYK